MRQLQFFSTADGDGSTQQSTGILQHEVYHLGGYLLCGTYQVAFVLTVLVVNNNDELSFTKVLQCLFNSIQLEVFHIHYYIILLFLLFVIFFSLPLLDKQEVIDDTLHIAEFLDARHELGIDALDELQVLIQTEAEAQHAEVEEHTQG